jgi:hypothetical protein
MRYIVLPAAAYRVLALIRTLDVLPKGSSCVTAPDVVMRARNGDVVPATCSSGGRYGGAKRKQR